MGQTIIHSGTVERVENGKAYVRILQASACSSCQAAKLCRSEAVAALSSRSVLVAYFFALYLLRDKLSQILSFKISNITNV